MARQEPSQKNWYAETQELPRTADLLSATHGMDRSRVMAIFARAMALRSKHGNSFPSLVAGQLQAAARRLTPEEALALFETEDLAKLISRAPLLDMLIGLEVPLYTLAELADLIEAFGEHLLVQRTAILSTGHPAMSFGPCRWLDRNLGRLYYVKFPPIIRAMPGQQGNSCFLYDWSPTPKISSTVKPDVSPVNLKAYESAPYVSGLDLLDVHRLGQERPRLLELKCRVLRQVTRSLRNKDVQGLWKGCFGLLLELLNHDQVAFLLRLDRFYRETEPIQSHLIGPEMSPESYPRPSGGLFDLVDLIGHCALEISLEVYSSTKTELERVARKASLSDWRELLGESYYEIVCRPWRAELDTILDAWWKGLLFATHNFWPEYSRWVRCDLEKEFYEEIEIRVRVRKRLASPFERQLQRFADRLKDYQEETGEVLPLPQMSGTTHPAYVVNSFRLEGAAWRLTYAGRTVTLNDMLGLHYIAHLIREQGRKVHVRDLASLATVSGAPPARPTSSMSLAWAGENLNLTDQIESQEVLDHQARREYKRRLKELTLPANAPRPSNEATNPGASREEAEMLRRELRRDLGLGGRSRALADPHKKVRQAVSRTLRYSLRKVTACYPLLGEHLSRAIRTGSHCSYDPTSPISWKL